MKAIIQRDRRDAVAASATAALLFCVIVPLQTYLGNPGVFDYGLGRLLLELAVAWVVCTIALSALLLLLGRVMGRLPHVMLLAFVVYEYLATGIMTIGFPTLDGESFFFVDRGRRIADCALFFVCFAAGAISFKWIRNYITHICCGLLILMFASLFDVKGEKLPEAKEISGPFSDGMCPKLMVAEKAVFSESRNVMVFVLDSMTTELFNDIVLNEEGYADTFSGFVSFTDNIGMHYNTAHGVPGILTGKYYSGGSVGAYVASCYSEDSVLFDYKRMNVPIFAMLGCFDKSGYAHVGTFGEPERPMDFRGKVKGFALTRRIDGSLSWNLLEIAKFRLTPFVLKSRVMRSMMSRWKMFDESIVYPFLAVSWITKAPLTFHFYHTVGCHAPYTTLRNGERCQSLEGYAGAYEKGCFAIGELAKLLNEFKKRGIYDNSFIVVTADHGCFVSKRESAHGVDLKDEPGLNKGFPCLAVKPVEASGRIELSSARTTHANIARLLREVASRQLAKDEVVDVLTASGKRLFRYPGIDWVFSENGEVSKSKFAPCVDPMTLPTFELKKTYDLAVEKIKGNRFAPVLFENIDGAWLEFSKGTVKMILRAPASNQEYNLEIGVKANKATPGVGNAEKDEAVVRSGDAFCRLKSGQRANLLISGVKSNAKGIIEIDITKEESENPVWLESFCVREIQDVQRQP